MTPFEDSRRLTGSNVWFAGCGAVLEAAPWVAVDAALLARWRVRVGHMLDALGWPRRDIVAVPHPGGASLAFAAPVDALLCATEVNEWAWCTAIATTEPDASVDLPHAPGHPAAWDETAALRTLRALAAMEASPRLRALCDAAQARALPVLLDDDTFTLGTGVAAMSWPMAALPAPESVPWAALRAVPSALVTGSNGKTTTVRLIAALGRAHGWRVGFSSTDGLVVGGEPVAAGDYSGPVGARTVLRDARVEAAVLETARGGMLRRGLALDLADVAVVTNVSADHFGEYGVFDLARLTDVKLAVAHAVAARGLLVLNADDAGLREAATRVRGRIGWFGLDLALLATRHGPDTPVCGVRDGHLWLLRDGTRHDLGAVAAMPLSVGGRARYNIANLAAAALAGAELGVAPATIAQVFAHFGRENTDNRGRLERWSLDGVSVWLDYAHNPDGLASLLDVVRGAAPQGRLGLLLGQAGNRRHACCSRTFLATNAAAATAPLPRCCTMHCWQAACRRRRSPTAGTRWKPCANCSPGRTPATRWCCRCTAWRHGAP